MSDRRAPFAGKKVKKPEYEETPIVTIVNPTLDLPVKVETEPTSGHLDIPEKEITEEVYLEQQTRPLTIADRFMPREPPKIPVIQGVGTAPIEAPPERVEPEPTSQELTGGREIEDMGRWRDASLAFPITTAVEVGEQGTRHKLVPKNDKDGANKET